MSVGKEACPACGSQTSTLMTTVGRRPYFHECSQCGTRWGHACFHCHDDPPVGHICPVCGRVAS